MFSTEFDVLLVDDEPDVLAVSRMAQRGTRVYGVPLKLHQAESKSRRLRSSELDAGDADSGNE